MTLCDRLPTVNKFMCRFKLKTGIVVIMIFTLLVSAILSYCTYFCKSFYLPTKNSINFKSWFIVILVLWGILMMPIDVVWTGAIQGESVDILLKIEMSLILTMLLHHLAFSIIFMLACMQDCLTIALVHFGFFTAVLIFMSYTILIVNSFRIKNHNDVTSL